jgi:uncharacterized membrane protein YbhN (UPF0104 family)
MLRKLISLLVLACVLVGIIYAIQSDRERFQLVLQIRWFDIALLALCSLGFIATQGAVLQAASRPFGVRLNHLEAFVLLVSSSFVNQAVPFSGVGLRGAYLFRRHNLHVADCSALMTGILIIEFAVYGAAALVASAWLSLGEIHPDPLVILVCAAAVIAAVGAAILPLQWLPSRPALVAALVAQIAALRKVLRDPAVLGLIIFWTMFGFICLALAFAVAYEAIGAAVPFSGAMIAAALSDFSFVVRIAPGAAGSLDAAIYYVSSLFSLTLSDSLIIALLVRLGLAMVFLPLGLPCFWLLFRGARGLPERVQSRAPLGIGSTP